MAASIKDVAKRAGVSIATVSRILNNSAGVKDAKAEAVREAVAFYNYEPNQFGRGLVKQTSETIGVYMGYGSFFSNRYTMELLRGIEEGIAFHGYNLLLIYDLEPAPSTPKFMEHISKRQIDGLLLGRLSVDTGYYHQVLQLLEEGFPIGYVGPRAHENGFNVYSNHENYLYRMLKKSYENGHRKVGMLPLEGNRSFYQKACKRAQQAYPDLEVCSFQYEPEPTIESAPAAKYLAWIEQHLRELVLQVGCTLLWAGSVQEYGAYLSILQSMGKAVPQDVSILCAEHAEHEGESLFPTVSAYHVPSFAMGKELASMLIDFLKGNPQEKNSVEFKPRFIERETLRSLN